MRCSVEGLGLDSRMKPRSRERAAKNRPANFGVQCFSIALGLSIGCHCALRVENYAFDEFQLSLHLLFRSINLPCSSVIPGFILFLCAISENANLSRVSHASFPPRLAGSLPRPNSVTHLHPTPLHSANLEHLIQSHRYLSFSVVSSKWLP